MLKPIKTVRLKTAGSSVRFARRITDRAAVFGNYELSESELVFLIGAAREQSDLTSVLELLDKVLDLVKRGFDRRTNALSVRMVNNIGIILSRGGFSREYNKTLELYNKISAAVDGKTESFNYSECRKEIQNTLSILRSQTNKRTEKTRGKTLKTISEKGKTVSLNTLNSGIIKIMSRNPELLKMIRSDRVFTELSLKNIEKIRRRTDRVQKAERFLDALTNDQIEFLERFISENDLFSEHDRFIKETNNFSSKNDQKSHLRFLLENSSEKSFFEFFNALKESVERKISILSSQNSENSSNSTVKNSDHNFDHFDFFESKEKMREFFIGAKTFETERLIKELRSSEAYYKEASTLEEALRIYEKRSKMIKEFDRKNSEKAAEILRDSEAVLEKRLKEESFSTENFFAAVTDRTASRELKKYFADYAWENYRSEESMRRFAEYLSNDQNGQNAQEAPGLGETAVLRQLVSDPGGLKTDDPAIKETEKSSEFRMIKEKFSDFLVNSKEIDLKFSEISKKSFINSSSDVVSAFAEYFINTVREDSFNYFSDRVMSLAEKTERILYYENYYENNHENNRENNRENPGAEKRSVEIFSLISESWDECSPTLAELFSSFTRAANYNSGIFLRSEIGKLYSYLPKNNFRALSGFFEAAAQGDEYFLELSEKFADIFLDNTTVALDDPESEEILNISNGASDYTFLDALNEVSDNALTLLLPLVGNDHDDRTDRNNASVTVPEKSNITDKTKTDEARIFSEHELTAYLDRFSEYLSNTVSVNNAAQIGDITGDIIDEASENSRENNRENSSENVTENIRENFSNIRENSSEKAIENSEKIRNFSEEFREIFQTEGSGKALELVYREWLAAPEFMSKLLADHDRYRLSETEGKNSAVSFSEHIEKLLRGKDPENQPGLGLEIKSEIKKLSVGNNSEFITDQNEQNRLIMSLSSVLNSPVFSEISSTSGSLVFNIRGGFEDRNYRKNIVINKKFHNAVKAFYNSENSENYENGISDISELSDIWQNAVIKNAVSENLFANSGYSFVLENPDNRESENITPFSRTVSEMSEKTHLRTKRFREAVGNAAVRFSDRISEKITEESRRSEYNTAAEIFYTDEYFEYSAGVPGGNSNTGVNFALPAASQSASASDNVSETIGNIHEKIEAIEKTISAIQQKEEDLSREFVTKSEQKIFERELKSGIERDIYLAGKRRGIY